MLVLSRKMGETIVIDGDIRVTILGVSGRGGNPQIRIGVEAPDDVSIDREEIHLRKVNGEPIK